MKRFLAALAVTLGFQLFAGQIAAQTATPMPTPSSNLECTLNVVSGEGEKVPTSVTFRAQATMDGEEVKKFKYHFGDGTAREGGKEISHKYTNPGTYGVLVQVKEADGDWVSTSSCSKNVQVAAKNTTPTPDKSPTPTVTIEPGSCQLTVSGDEERAPETVYFTIRIDDQSKDRVEAYRVEFGDGSKDSGVSPRFSHRYMEAGTYQAKGYYRLEGEDTWEGGEDLCQEQVRIFSGTDSREQPDTGTPLVWLLGSAASGAAGLGWWLKERLR